MNKYKVIVVGNDHYNTLNVIRSLGKDDFDVRVVIISESIKTKSFVLKSRFVSHGFVLSESEVVDFLMDRLADPQVNIPVIPTYDGAAAVLDKSYDRLSEFFILPSVARTQGMLTANMNKELQVRQAGSVGFKVPASVVMELDKYSGDMPRDVVLPCIVKPLSSFRGSKNDFRVCDTPESLNDVLMELKGRVPEVLIQQFIPNDEILLVGGVRTEDGRNFCYGEINKYKKSNAVNSMGLCCLGYLLPDSELTDLCKRLVELIDYRGCYSVEAVRAKAGDEKEDYFIEINLRTDGLYYFYDCMGIDFPAIWVRSCYGLPVDVRMRKNKVFGMNEFLYLKHCLSLKSVADFWKTDVFSTFRWTDLKPFVFKFIYR